MLLIAGETLLEEVVVMASRVGLVKPQDHIVCVQRMGESFVIKIVSVNESGDGVEIIRPKSLINLIRVRTPPPPPLTPPCFTCPPLLTKEGILFHHGLGLSCPLLPPPFLGNVLCQGSELCFALLLLCQLYVWSSSFSMCFIKPVGHRCIAHVASHLSTVEVLLPVAVRVALGPVPLHPLLLLTVSSRQRQALGGIT